MEIQEDTDTVSVELEGVTYTLKREITGAQFQDLRKKAIRSDGADPEKAKIDTITFDFWNTLYRLEEPNLTEDQLGELPRKVYHKLTLVTGMLDTKEMVSVSDFLRENSSFFQSSLSTLGLFSDSPPAGSEAT